VTSVRNGYISDIKCVLKSGTMTSLARLYMKEQRNAKVGDGKRHICSNQKLLYFLDNKCST